MQRASFRLLIAVALVTSPLSAVRAAHDPPEPSADSDFELELKARDLESITMDVMARYPILAASPGIKSASGSRMLPSGETAHVIFYPHAETRGVKHALQVHCNRSEPTWEWACPTVQERRYVKLDTQDFEVRVVGDVDVDGVLALKEATRALATSALPDTMVHAVSCMYEFNGNYLVGWVSANWREGVSVQATLKAGGNAANEADWTAFLLDENGGRAE